MRIAISGSSGLVGSALAEALRTEGHEVLRLVRRAPQGDDEIRWNPAEDVIPADAFHPLDAVVHLAGAGIADRPWNAARKREIWASRVEGTGVIARALARGGPRTLVMASAVGYYGDRAEEHLTEESSRGDGFLPELVEAWEAAADPARVAGVRVAALRLGVVLSPAGGALAKMLPAFRLGGGAVLGAGDQYFPWISLRDVVATFTRTLKDEALRGPINAVAPQAVTNREYTKTLARVLRRPAFLPAPAWALKLAFGELAEEALLASQRVVPERLTSACFSFQDPTLDGCLRRQLEN